MIDSQWCRIGTMTPFTAPRNASGRDVFFGATIITYTIIIQGVKPVVAQQKNTCFLEVFFHKLSQETPIQISCEVSVSICDNSSGVSVLLET